MSDEKSRAGEGDETVFDGSVAPQSLGASATYAAEAKRRGKRRGGGDGEGGDAPGGRSWLPSLKPGVAFIVGFALIVALAFVPMVGSSLKKTPRDRVGISYGGGPFEGANFQKIVMPGSGLFFNGWFDPLYLYPADQQNYIVSTGDNGSGGSGGGGGGAKQGTGGTGGAGGSTDTAAAPANETAAAGSKSTVSGRPIIAPSKDRVQVTYQAAVYYKLNIDELRAFHEEFGLKYRAFEDAGWKDLISDTLRQQIENALLEETRRYDIGEIYGDVDVLLNIQNAVQSTLSERLGLAMGGSYFCAPTYEKGGECGNPTFVVKSIDVPSSIVSAYESNRSSAINIETRENELEQRRIEAQGIDALNQAFGQNGDVYAMLRAIESGKINFWVVPGQSGLTLDTGGDGSDPPTTPSGDAAGD